MNHFAALFMLQEIEAEQNQTRMSIKEYLERNRAQFMDELKVLLDDLKEVNEGDFSKETMIGYVMRLANESADIYNRGFDSAIELIEKADVTLLKRELPPHLK